MKRTSAHAYYCQSGRGVHGPYTNIEAQKYCPRCKRSLCDDCYGYFSTDEYCYTCMKEVNTHLLPLEQEIELLASDDIQKVSAYLESLSPDERLEYRKRILKICKAYSFSTYRLEFKDLEQ